MGKQKQPKQEEKPQAKAQKNKIFTMGLSLTGYGRVEAGDECTSEIAKYCSDKGINIDKYLK